MKSVIGIVYATLVVAIVALAISVSGCGKKPDGQDPKKAFTGGYKGITISGHAIGDADPNAEKAFHEQIMRSAEK